MRLLGVLIISLSAFFLSGCSEEEKPAEEESVSSSDLIIGHWESPEWAYKNKPFFVQFTKDDKFIYMSDQGMMHKGSWMFLQSGELQLTDDLDRIDRCKVLISEKDLTIEATSCISGWRDFSEGHPTIKLFKK